MNPPLSARNDLIYTTRDFCKRFFPKAHAEKTCGCYPQKHHGVLVIRSKHPRSC